MIGGRRGAPYDGVVELKAAPEPKHSKLQSPHAPWVESIGNYERRETTIVEGLISARTLRPRA